MDGNCANSRNQETAETLAELVLYLDDPKQRKELEDFRIKYECRFGPTDLTQRYTSTWPRVQQEWLISMDPVRWFDGLPSFVKAFFYRKLELAASEGCLDNAPDAFIDLFLKRRLVLDHDLS